MRFSLVDRILEVEPGQRILAIKNLSLAEEYLADHFPRAPVMPGVLMLESLVQAGAWLVRISEDFAHSMVTLKEARGIKYASFVDPGQTLEITAEIIDQDEHQTRLKAQGKVGQAVTVAGKIVLAKYNLRDTNGALAATDAFVTEQQRRMLALLR